MGKKCGAQPKFSETEDKKLKDLVGRFGTGSWNQIATYFKDKSPKQCRDRWRNYADPRLRHDPWSREEDELLMRKYAEIGSRWTTMVAYFDNRSANDIRYRYMKITRTQKGYTTSSQISESPMIEEVDVKLEPVKIVHMPLELTPSKRIIIPMPHLLFSIAPGDNINGGIRL